MNQPVCARWRPPLIYAPTFVLPIKFAIPINDSCATQVAMVITFALAPTTVPNGIGSSIGLIKSLPKMKMIDYVQGHFIDGKSVCVCVWMWSITSQSHWTFMWNLIVWCEGEMLVL